MRRSFILTIAVFALCDTAFAQPSGSNFGYPSVAAALNALRNKTGVATSVEGGWTIITDRASHTLWSFTPAGHPAHPAGIRRVIVQEGDRIFVRMSVACEAQKPACDKLVAEFNQLNERMRQDLNSRR